MKYSVWDQGRRTYDYYETSQQQQATSAPKPAHLRSSALGESPDAAAWPLPSGAVKTGSGKYPKGYIASPTSGGLGLGIVSLNLSITNLVLLGAVGWFIWKNKK